MLFENHFISGGTISLERSIAIFFLVLSLTYGYAAFNYPLLPFERNMAFLPNTMPMVLSVIGANLSLVIIIFPDARGRPEPPDFKRQYIVQAVALLVAMILFAILLRPLGFILSTSIFLVGCGYALGERKPALMLTIAIGSAFCIWYLVQEVLGIYMRPWPGFIGPG